jgi:hypothetical protein
MSLRWNGCADRGGNACGRAGERIGHDIRHTWYKHKITCVFRYDARWRCWWREVEPIPQRLVVCPNLEESALQAGAEMFVT